MTPIEAAREDAAKVCNNSPDGLARKERILSGKDDRTDAVSSRLSAINLYLASQQANAPELVGRLRGAASPDWERGIRELEAAYEGKAAEWDVKGWMLVIRALLDDSLDAADALTAAHAQIAELRKALEPFAKDADYYDPPENDDDLQAFATNYRIGQLRAARAAIGGGQ